MKKKLIIITFFLLALATIKFLHITDYLSLDWLQNNIDLLKQAINQNYWFVVISYIGLYILATALSIPGSTLFIIAAGFLFGVIPGLIYATIAASLGAVILFFVSRYVIGEWVQKRYAYRFVKFNHEMKTYGYYYLLMTRLLAVLPFFLSNLLAGITKIPARTFLWTTAVGMLPYACIYAFAGSQLAHVGAVTEGWSPPMVALVVTIGVRVLVAPIFIKQMIKRHRSENK